MQLIWSNTDSGSTTSLINKSNDNYFNLLNFKIP